MDEKSINENEIFTKMAKQFFNHTWELLDKKERTQNEIDEMIHSAHASRFLWGKVGKPLNFERGEWQISRVYSVLNRSEPAFYHAKRCLAICLENNIEDFDIAFAYEAMARAHSTAGNIEEKEKYLTLAKSAGEKIKEKDDKNYFLSELETI
ncbi:MAG: hypothetical protein ACFFDW_03675 [Candidatus Thorarchaeota archaeon]